MKKPLAALAIVTIMLNVYVAYTEFQGTGSSMFKKTTDGGGGDIDLTKVTVPAIRLHDDILYDYQLIAQMYYKVTNESSEHYGEWEDYKLTIDGTLRRNFKGTTSVIDGFSESHMTLMQEQKTLAEFEISYRSSAGDDLKIPGTMEGTRTEFQDLTEKRTVEASTVGNVEVSRLPRVDAPVQFDGYMRSWPDPNIVPEKSIDELIYGDLKTVNLGDKDTIVKEKYYPDWQWTAKTEYNWSAEAAEMISEYPSLRINITTTLFGASELPFNETIWISNEVPFPTKKFTRTYTEWDDEDSEGFMLFETTNVIKPKKESGYTPGTGEIPWGQCGGTHWAVEHPIGEFKSWDEIPGAGIGYKDSSFLFKPEDARDFAEANSPNLTRWMSKYKRDQIFIEYATYNATPKVPGEEPGSYEWQMYYSYYPTMDEREKAQETDEWNFSMEIYVMRNITKSTTIGKDFDETTEISFVNDSKRSGGASISPKVLNTNMLTLASSEDIILSLPEVKANVTSTLSRGRIDWSKATYTWGAPALVGDAPGFQLVQTLTGLEFPTARTAWAVQSDTVWESGETYSCSVDGETGRFIYVTHIKGTALFGLFG